jgi:hypothetical protein
MRQTVRSWSVSGKDDANHRLHPANGATIGDIGNNHPHRSWSGYGFGRDTSLHSHSAADLLSAAIAVNYRLAAIVRGIDHYLPASPVRTASYYPLRCHAISNGVSPGQAGAVDNAADIRDQSQADSKKIA